ncbi:hypothetical protein C4D60_Mb06t23890 [Musa balbisiana]|uniref:Uncharacterized protein n=1 Tax=Musa balbisiana TaxID=52838 RepID=A0A4S8IQ73_MUSBA|nr:hypothetical protein C4D60_Mb06t23890 [Musa balbisiana]
MRLPMLSDAGGRLAFAAALLAVLASRRPSGTFHDGPPSCMAGNASQFYVAVDGDASKEGVR